jgi:molybdopterin-guanine dinucleotide biosynthesis protein A
VKRHRQVAAFILTGGASSRMGRDKGLLDFGGVPLIVHMARLIEPLVASVTVVGSPRRYAALGVPAIADQESVDRESKGIQRGPLTGIATALAKTRWPWNLIIACDLPYLSGAWLEWLLSRATPSRGQVVIPRSAHGLEPLAAVYRRECGGPIAAALARGARKVTDVIEQLRMDVIYPREWRRLDPRALVLKNMNTPGDYDEARKWWSGENLRDGRSIRKPRQSKRRRPRVATIQRG